MAVSKRIREIVRERDLFTCMKCGEYLGPFGTYSLQHRRARGSGGSKAPDTDLPANLVNLCGTATTGCHGEVEAHPTEALATGMRVSQGHSPLLVPLLTYKGWLLLDDEGGYVEVEPAP